MNNDKGCKVTPPNDSDNQIPYKFSNLLLSYNQNQILKESENLQLK